MLLVSLTRLCPYNSYTTQYHGASGGYPLKAFGGACEDPNDPTGPADLSNNTADAIRPARGLNGTYNRELFSDEAVRLIHAHDQSSPMWMYLAFMNIHDGCGRPFGR
jgi:hypothetical protein